MHFLISNDDGITARGIQALSQRMMSLGKVTIVAPDQNRSGASNSLTLEAPVRIKEVQERTFSVSGTPTDCVHIALTGLLDKDPDMVVSGINAGANLGDDVIYSGTVAAAMEGRFLGLPAIAVSLVFQDRPVHYETAAEAVVLLVERLRKDPLPADTILNINVPDLPWEEINGFEVTRLGHRHRAEPVVKTNDPRAGPCTGSDPPARNRMQGRAPIFTLSAGVIFQSHQSMLTLPVTRPLSRSRVGCLRFLWVRQGHRRTRHDSPKKTQGLAPRHRYDFPGHA